MGLEEVKEEILQQAEQAAARILTEGKQEAQRIRQDAAQRCATLRAEAEARTLQLVEQLERRMQASAAFESRRAILERKRTLIRQAIRDAAASIARWPEAKRAAMIRRLIRRAQEEIPVQRVLAHPHDRAAVEAAGVQFLPGTMEAGVCAQTADGNVSVDYAVESMLAEIEERAVQDMSRILFGETGFSSSRSEEEKPGREERAAVRKKAKKSALKLLPAGGRQKFRS